MCNVQILRKFVMTTTFQLPILPLLVTNKSRVIAKLSAPLKPNNIFIFNSNRLIRII